MAAYEYETVGVFTDRQFSGNPLAVFPHALGLSSEQMQRIAAEFNLSETTFVLPPDNPQHHARVRIFTPRSELGFAGHPNVGTGFVLGRRTKHPPDHFVFEEGAGLVRVHLLRGADRAICGARISAPRSLSIGDDVPVELVAACTSLRPEEIATGAHTPLMASVGTPFAIAEVVSVAALSRATPDLAAFREAENRFPMLALHLYAWVGDGERRVRARMFAPSAGVMEDPATGSANAALAALLTSLAPGSDVDLLYEIEQGVEMGRPSKIIAGARKEVDGPVVATVSGDCVAVMRGLLEM
jgi:trans-2,3-dihydro-3-hydroxyanthranilate isomerase